MAIIDLRGRGSRVPTPEQERTQSLVKSLTSFGEAIPTFFTARERKKEKEEAIKRQQAKELLRQQEKLQAQQAKEQAKVEEVEGMAQRLMHAGMPANIAYNLAMSPKGSDKNAIINSFLKGDTWPKQLGRLFGVVPENAYEKYAQSFSPLAQQFGQQGQGLQGLIGQQTSEQSLPLEQIFPEGLPPEVQQLSEAEMQRIASNAQQYGRSIPEQLKIEIGRGTINEGLGNWLLRNIVGRGTDILTAGANLVPNLIGSVANAITSPESGLYSGHAQEIFEDFPELQKRAQERFEALPEAEKEKQRVVPKIPELRTREQIVKPLLKNIAPKKYLEPSSKAERVGQEIAEDIGVFMAPLPIGKTPKFSRRLWTSLKSAGGGATGKFLAEKLGYGEKGQQVAKMAGTFVGAIAGKNLLRNEGRDLIKQTEERAQKLGDKAKVPHRKIYELNNIIEEGVEKGLLDTDKKFEKTLSALINKDVGTTADLIGADRAANDFLSRNWKKLQSTDKKVISNFKEGIAKTIEEQAKSKQIPQSIFNDYYKAKEFYSASYATAEINKTLDKVLPNTVAGSGLTLMLLLGRPERAIAMGAISGGKMALKGMFDTGLRLLKFPSIRSAYEATVKNAALGKVQDTKRSAQKLDRELKKKEKAILRQS